MVTGIMFALSFLDKVMKLPQITKDTCEYERAPSGMLELWERVQVEWEKIEPEVCQNLIESMPMRVTAVVKAKGGHTKY